MAAAAGHAESVGAEHVTVGVSPMSREARFVETDDFAVWRDVDDGHISAWRRIFRSSREGPELAAACPVCGNHSLHRWFHLYRAEKRTEFGEEWLGKGSEWEWCSNCRSHEHSSGLVPAWWKTRFVVPLDDLRGDPGPLGRAFQRRRLHRAIDENRGQTDAAADKWEGGSTTPHELGLLRVVAEGRGTRDARQIDLTVSHRHGPGDTTVLRELEALERRGLVVRDPDRWGVGGVWAVTPAGAALLGD